MDQKLERSAHDERDHRTGQYRATPLCDGCNKPVGTNYFSDADVCGGSDGPGFFICERKRCEAALRDLGVEERRAVYMRNREARKSMSAKRRAVRERSSVVSEELKLFAVYRLVREKGARKLRLWRYMAIASSVEQAIARAKEENRGSTTLPEEKKVVWGALEQEGWTVPVGLIFVDEVPACMRDEWFGDA